MQLEADESARSPADPSCPDQRQDSRDRLRRWAAHPAEPHRPGPGRGPLPPAQVVAADIRLPVPRAGRHGAASVPVALVAADQQRRAAGRRVAADAGPQQRDGAHPRRLPLPATDKLPVPAQAAPSGSTRIGRRPGGTSSPARQRARAHAGREPARAPQLAYAAAQQADALREPADAQERYRAALELVPTARSASAACARCSPGRVRRRSR